MYKNNNFYTANNSVDFSEEDKKFMKLAIKLANKAKGMTNPNPLVGAVIVKNGEIISTGYHKMFGGLHAEIEAINAVKNKKNLAGAKMYVTLEPCSIFGKTPPCVDAIIRYKFGEIIIGSIDPNPKVDGSGIKKLIEAKIKVKVGLFQDKIARQNEVFFKHIRKKMPFVCCKIALSLDGKVATKNSNSKWITGQASRKLVQRIRKEFECILTGINTVLIDNPYLYPHKNSNKEQLLKPDLRKNRKFYRAILDTNLRINNNLNIVKTANIIKTLVFTSNTNFSPETIDKIKKLKDNGIELINVKKISSTKLDLIEILKILYNNFTISSVLVESGPTLLTELLKENLIDKFYIFIAPKIIGGDSNYNVFSELNILNLNNAVELKYEKIKKIGEDIFLTAYPVSRYEIKNL